MCDAAKLGSPHKPKLKIFARHQARLALWLCAYIIAIITPIMQRAGVKKIAC
jgi:hypothetical protein